MATVLAQPAAVPALAAGSDDDFDRLYRASYSKLLVLLSAILEDTAAAEDCVQEAFVRAYRSWRQWRGDAPAEVWLQRIALNVAKSHLRWSKLRQIEQIVRRLGNPRTSDSQPAGLRLELTEGLRRLPPEQAAAIVLRHYHGYSNREIAQVLGIPESTVASRLAKAKQRLRAELSERMVTLPDSGVS
jgi:RNA polymerase sigma-70 factor (ECF subfamily)